MIRFTHYGQVLDYIYRHLPMYQRVGPAAYKADLQKTLLLDDYFDHPHRAYPAIHIAGTNGKGSVAHMLASVCQTAGLKTGLYTSPHLKDFTERIKIDGESVPAEEVLHFFNTHAPVFDKLNPSFFEMSVMLAFDYFRRESVDIAVVETGLGGRLDSTNIINPLVSVITNIGIDHTQFLGTTLKEIAGEKAGIIKPGIPVVVGEALAETRPVFEARVAVTGSSLKVASDNYNIPYGFLDKEGFQVVNVYANDQVIYEMMKMDLTGMYQRKNVITVLATLDVLSRQGWLFSARQIREGLSSVVRQTGIRGRWEVLSGQPLVVADTAHNVQGLSAVLEQIAQMPWKKLYFVLGFVADKALEDIVPLFPVEADYVFTQAKVPRALEAGKLAEGFLKKGITGSVVENPGDALTFALKKAGPEDMILVGGSTFVVADVL